MADYQSQYTGAQHDAYVTKASLIDLIYPVGAIYMSVNSTSPTTLFGGTWVAIAGKFLVGTDSTFTAGETGGNDKHTHMMAHTHTYAHTHTTPATTTGAHTLTIAEMPRHLHQQAYNWTNGGSASASGGEPWAITTTSGTGDGVGTWPYGTDAGASAFGYTGGGGPILILRSPLPQIRKAQIQLPKQATIRLPKYQIYRLIQRFICGKEQHKSPKGGVC